MRQLSDGGNSGEALVLEALANHDRVPDAHAGGPVDESRPVRDIPVDDTFWHRFLPGAVRFSAGGEPVASGLRRAERQSLGSAGDFRVREFAAGRWHARCALAKLGLGDVVLPRRSDGAPSWPAGIVGSIAHTVCEGRIYAIAAVARSNAVIALGVDVEAPSRLAPRVWPRLLTEYELEWLLSLPSAQRGPRVLERWCAKEAIAKANGCIGDLRQIEVHALASDSFTAAATPAKRLDAACALQPGDCYGTSKSNAAGWTFAVAARLAPEAAGVVPS